MVCKKEEIMTCIRMLQNENKFNGQSHSKVFGVSQHDSLELGRFIDTSGSKSNSVKKFKESNFIVGYILGLSVSM